MNRIIKPLIDPNTPPEAMDAEYERKFALQEQSWLTMRALLAEPTPEAKRNLYLKLKQINDDLGIPTASMQAMDILPLELEGGAA